MAWWRGSCDGDRYGWDVSPYLQLCLIPHGTPSHQVPSIKANHLKDAVGMKSEDVIKAYKLLRIGNVLPASLAPGLTLGFVS